MKKAFLIFSAIGIVATMLFFIMSMRGDLPMEHAASSFDECVSLGNPVMESYPRQCIDAYGNHFTESVPTPEPDQSHNAALHDVRETGGSGSYMGFIGVSNPEPRAVITSPLAIKGEARGPWYFEATFSVVLVDWDGRIIAETYATADGEWMTTEFVPFDSTVTFEKPYPDSIEPEEFMKRGWLILKKANASGLPEHDAAIEIPIRFEE